MAGSSGVRPEFEAIIEVVGGDVAKFEVKSDSLRRRLSRDLSIMSSNNGRWRKKAALD